MKNILERIREVQKKKRLKGILPEVIILSVGDFEELADYFIELNKKDFSSMPLDFKKVLGMTIIVGDEKIIKLNENI